MKMVVEGDRGSVGGGVLNLVHSAERLGLYLRAHCGTKLLRDWVWTTSVDGLGKCSVASFQAETR